MANHTHICEDCESEFDGDGVLVEVDDDGTLGCDCLRQDKCADCEANCERCQDWDGVYTPATTANAAGQPRCQKCADKENESAFERAADKKANG